MNGLSASVPNAFTRKKVTLSYERRTARLNIGRPDRRKTPTLLLALPKNG
jgi:hypothetical protein